MKAPICDVCLKNDILCEGCSKKLEEGEISEEAVEISRFLYSLTDEYPYLEDVEIVRVWAGEKVLIVVTPKEDVGKVVGKGGEIVKLMAKKWNRAIRIVEMNEDVKKLSRNLLSDVKVYRINKVYSPDGNYFKVVVNENDKNKVMIKKEEFTDLVNKLTGEKAKIRYA